jgi:hypothetical protein
VVVLAVAGVGLWFGLRGSGSDHATGPIPLAGHDLCADQVRISVTTDTRMRAIAAAVVNDPQAKTVYTQTQQEALANYQREFAGQSDLLALARPGVLPAAVVVVPVSGVDVHQLATRYRTEFTDAKQIRPLARADAAVAAAGDTDPPTPCPASGEFRSTEVARRSRHRHGDPGWG